MWPLNGPLRASLLDTAVDSPLCRIVPAPDRIHTALEWTQEALAAGDDAGANVAVRQAPLVSGVHLVGDRALDGLPGFLADSLPDSWGRLLVDRQLARRGVSPRTLSGVDRLAIVGERGPGAIAYAPATPLEDVEPRELLDLDALAAGSALVLEGRDAAVLASLERAGGSAGGSRPKAWVAEAPDGVIRSGAHALEPGETGWLVKFRAPRHDPPDVARVELAYARMARSAGLDVAEPRLFETADAAYFASLRFDRDGPCRVHCLTAAALLDIAPAQAMAADYADLLRLTRHVTRSAVEVEMAYRHAVFNVLTHNRDDHLKQFAFLRRDGRWARTPAYDLTFSDGPRGEHTLLVAGEARRPGRSHLATLAREAGLTKAAAERVVTEVSDAVRRWPEHADAAGVGESREHVSRAIEDALAAP